MNKRAIVCMLLGVVSCTMLGCSNSEIEKLKKIDAMDIESTVNALNLSVSDTESIIYSQISDRTLLDLTSLDTVPDEDKKSVDTYMDGIKTQVETGEGDFLDKNFLNYIYFEFEKTPYKWEQKEVNIRGIDALSRNIVVDVTYKTTSDKKVVKGNSNIVLGEPDYDKKMTVRRTNWIGVLRAKTGRGGEYQTLLNKFVSVYGDPNEIIANQSSGILAERVENGDVPTYECMVDTPEENTGATMVMRYVLVPSYKLGINLGLECKHMYMLSYEVDNDPTTSMKVYTEEGNDAINDSIDSLMHSYYVAIDEDNHSGLYKLVSDYGKYDKYFKDYFESTFRKNAGYTITLFDIDDRTVTCGVTLSRKVRAKNTYMTLPTYVERYLYTFKLESDGLKLENEVLLSSKISGEPAITSESAQTTGFKSNITLSNNDKKAIEQVIANLGVLQVKKDTSSDKFGNVVDISLSNSALTDIKSNMTSIECIKKATWVSTYLQGYSNFASVSLKELYQKEDKSIYECQSVVDLIYKNGAWYVYNYKLNTSDKLQTKTLSTKGASSVVTDKVEEFTPSTSITNTIVPEDDIDFTGVNDTLNTDNKNSEEDNKKIDINIKRNDNEESKTVKESNETSTSTTTN